MEVKRIYDLEERLIAFAVLIIRICESLNNTRPGNHIGSQLIRSGTSPALNYGEAQSAESRSDFIHKIKVVLKELRESKNALRIIKQVPLTDDLTDIDNALKEINELISIFVKSLETAKKNFETERKSKNKAN